MRPPSYRQRLFVEHDLGGSLGSAVDAARRAGYPWPEQMARKMLRNVEKCGVHTARNGPSPPHTCRGPGGPGGNEHGGSPWFQRGVEPGRAPAGEGREPIGCVERAMTHRSASRCVCDAPHLLSAHAPRPPLVGSAVAAARRAGSSNPYPAGGQYATTCYVFRFWQKFSELSFRRKLL